MKIKENNFYIRVVPLIENNNTYWLSEVFDKNNKKLKEFIDKDKRFTRLKADLWLDGWIRTLSKQEIVQEVEKTEF